MRAAALHGVSEFKFFLSESVFLFVSKLCLNLCVIRDQVSLLPVLWSFCTKRDTGGSNGVYDLDG